MSRKPSAVLKGQTRKMVFDVFSFMKSESKTECDAVKRTAEATSTSESTVRRIVNESKSSDVLNVFRTPGKKRTGKKSVTNIDILDKTVIKRCIHNYHVANKELPTVEKLRHKLKEDINFKGSERSLRRIIKELGFQWKKTDKTRRLLLEKSYIRCQRIEYLEKIIQYRAQGRHIVYSDESYIDSSSSSSKTWIAEYTKELKIPNSKVQRAVLIHAGSESGFVPNTLLIFKVGTKPGDQLNFENYQKWVYNQLLPNLPPNSVLVIDNESYHNKQCDPAPKSTSKRADLQKWLTDRGIKYDENMYNPQLYKLVKLNKQPKRFIIDEILAEHGHTVLRLPPNHSDLSPIETIWTQIKEYISNKNLTFNLDNAIQLAKEKVTATGTQEWVKLCTKVKEIELEYVKSDRVVDEAIEEFIVYGNDDVSSDSDDDEADNEEDSEEEGEEGPAPCGSCGSVN